MKSFITKLLSTTLVLLISLSLINISILSSEEEEDEPTLDSGVYTFTIPATLHIKGDGNDKLTMLAEWGKGIEGILISEINSKNNHFLVTDDGASIEYEFEPGFSSSSTYSTYLENIIVLLDEYKYAGNYTDTLTFEIEPIYIECNITYELDDATWKDDYSPVANYTINDTVTLPTSSNVSKEGFTFAGWYLDETHTDGPITSFSGLSYVDGITVYAKWVEISTDDIPIVEEETPIEEVVEEIKEDETTEQEIVEEEKKEEETIPEVVEEIVNEEEAND